MRYRSTFIPALLSALIAVSAIDQTVSGSHLNQSVLGQLNVVAGGCATGHCSGSVHYGYGGCGYGGYGHGGCGCADCGHHYGGSCHANLTYMGISAAKNLAHCTMAQINSNPLFHWAHCPIDTGAGSCYNCGCNGSYKFPVPPLYTYHWPGMYSQQLMTDYQSPWRFPAVRPFGKEHGPSGYKFLPPSDVGPMEPMEPMEPIEHQPVSHRGDADSSGGEERGVRPMSEVMANLYGNR